MLRRMRTLLALAAALATAAGFTACAGLGGPLVITLTEHELDGLVQRRLPQERRVLEVFDVTLPAASLRLLPQANRISVAMTVRVRERLLGAAWQGRLSLDAALRWHAPDQTVRLSQVQVQEFKVDGKGSPAPARGVVERVGAALAERVLDDFAVYKLPEPRAAQLQRLGLAPGAVTVTARGVEITFAPAAH